MDKEGIDMRTNRKDLDLPKFLGSVYCVELDTDNSFAPIFSWLLMTESYVNTGPSKRAHSIIF